MSSLNELTAVEIVDAIVKGEVSAREVVSSCLDRIDLTDDELGAWIERDSESALKQAEIADERRPNGGSNGSLDGVPIAVKDIIDVAGFRTQAGFGPFADHLAHLDAEVVTRMRAAGAIFLGKVSTAQFAVADPPATISPWDPALTPGGSSTGSGVAVAARQVPMALGTQTGGSILRPAAYNGVVGFKPTFGMVSTHGVYPLAPSLDHVGVLARSVSDCAAFLNVAGPGTSVPPEVDSNSTQDLGRPPRLGVLNTVIDSADEVIARAVRSAIESLDNTGAEIHEVELEHPLRILSATYRVIMQTEASETHRHLLTTHRDDYEPLLKAYLDVGKAIPAWVFFHAQKVRGELSDRFDRWMRGLGVDVLLLPTTPAVPPDRKSTGSSAFLSPFSLLATPAISLPCGVISGLPQAIQLVGVRGDDERLLSVAQWCEQTLSPAPTPPCLPSPT